MKNAPTMFSTYSLPGQLQQNGIILTLKMFPITASSPLPVATVFHLVLQRRIHHYRSLEHLRIFRRFWLLDNHRGEIVFFAFFGNTFFGNGEFFNRCRSFFIFSLSAVIDQKKNEKKGNVGHIPLSKV